MMMQGAGLGLGDESERCACCVWSDGEGGCVSGYGVGVEGGQRWLLEEGRGSGGARSSATTSGSNHQQTASVGGQKYVPRFPSHYVCA